ncbi:hypothetical protein, conserved [Eimeria tenella]|uniref:Uncharacterized protein n=1 Tax=Eimeria tenella TaxID=5802 RepID=U6KVW5_EIMTE|nr:hypothetical protein, conserved [Eimeria tenella]CDJ40479.1 hypothetical protein, conserved [Eimeria tenella]|eukprot:XP_013231229.1 hypothetical protein, conserved [Eimeria tenella]
MKASPSTRTAKGRSHVVLQKNKHVYTPSLARRYHGFCPWKERPNGGALPEIDRIVVDEHISSCNDCCDASLKRNGRGDEVICTRCFFNSFIIKRRPCLLRLVKSQNQDDGRTEYSLADCRALRYWKDLDYLDQAAGDETIDVEVRDTKMPDSFGADFYRFIFLADPFTGRRLGALAGGTPTVTDGVEWNCCASAGRGQYKQLGFREVLKRLREGDTSLYVSTQRIASDKYGTVNIFG